MKKKILRFSAVFIIVAALVPACDMLEDCGTCELITQYGDGTSETTLSSVFCGDNYTDKVNSTPITVGEGDNQITTYWSCD